MTDNQPSGQVTYHSSLHRHVHSISHKEQSSRFSSQMQFNQFDQFSQQQQLPRTHQPQEAPNRPSILSKSNYKRSQEKSSVKKGLTRVSVSKASSRHVTKENSPSNDANHTHMQSQGHRLVFVDTADIPSKKPKVNFNYGQPQQNNPSALAQKQKYQDNVLDEYKIVTYVTPYRTVKEEFDCDQGVHQQQSKNQQKYYSHSMQCGREGHVEGQGNIQQSTAEKRHQRSTSSRNEYDRTQKQNNLNQSNLKIYRNTTKDYIKSRAGHNDNVTVNQGGNRDENSDGLIQINPHSHSRDSKQSYFQDGHYREGSIQITNPPLYRGEFELTTWRNSDQQKEEQLRHGGQNGREEKGREHHWDYYQDYCREQESRQQESRDYNQVQQNESSSMLAQSKLLLSRQGIPLIRDDPSAVQANPSKLKHLEKQIVLSEKRNTSLQQQLRQFKHQNHLLLSQNQDLSQKLKQLQSDKMAALRLQQSSGAESSSTLQQLQLHNSKLQKEISALNLAVTELKGKNRALQQDQRAAADLNEKQLSRRQSRIQFMQEKLKSKQQQFTQVKGQCEKLKRQLTQYVDQINCKNKVQNQALKQQTKQWEQDYKRLQRKYCLMQNQLGHLKYIHKEQQAKENQQDNSQVNLQQQHHTKETLIQRQQRIIKLQDKLRIAYDAERKRQSDYLQLKQNFTALQQLYMKSQKQIDNLKIQVETVRTQTIRSYNTAQLTADKQHQNKLDKITQLLKHSDQDRLAMSTQIKRLQGELSSLQKENLHQNAVNQTILKENTLLQTSNKDLNQRYLKELGKAGTLANKFREEQKVIKGTLERDHQRKLESLCLEYEQMIKKVEKKVVQEHLRTLRDTLGKEHQRKVQALCQEYEVLIKKMKVRNVDEQQQRILKIENENKMKMEELCEQYQIAIKKLERNLDQQAKKISELMAVRSQHQFMQNDGTQRQHSMQLKRSRSRQPKHERYTHTIVNVKTSSQKDNIALIRELQHQVNTCEQKIRTLTVHRQALQEKLDDKDRKLFHLEQQVSHYQKQKDSHIREKLGLADELDQAHQTVKSLQAECTHIETISKQIKLKYDELAAGAENHERELRDNQLLIIEQEELILRQEKGFKEQMALTEQMREGVTQLEGRIFRLTQQVDAGKTQIDHHRSKEEYYKMLYEKKQAELLALSQAPKDTKISRNASYQHLKLNRYDRYDQVVQRSRSGSGQISRSGLISGSASRSRQKIRHSGHSRYSKQSGQFTRSPSSSGLEQKSQQQRKIELYRLKVYRDINTLLHITEFNLESMKQENYLDALYSRLKHALFSGDSDKRMSEDVVQLKKVILEMQESFRQEKNIIKKDYDLVYEKYLKYKTMCQSMEKDIERYKLRLLCL